MKRITTSQRVLCGVLVLAGGAWVVDRWSAAHKPEAARGATSAAAAASAGPADWREVSDLVARLTRTETTSADAELAELERDLFVPTEQFESTLRVAAPPEPPKLEVVETPTSEPVELSFSARHKLSGVVIGNSPLAVIDDRLLPLNAELDGYILVEAFRDYVVFQQRGTGERVELGLTTGVTKP